MPKQFCFKQLSLTLGHSLFLLDPEIGPYQGFTTPGQSGPWSNGNEGVLRIPQRSSVTEASPSDYLVLYPGISLGESYHSAAKLSVYSQFTGQVYIWCICKINDALLSIHTHELIRVSRPFRTLLGADIGCRLGDQLNAMVDW